MPPIERKYFVCANSSQGFFSFFSENLTGLDQVYILKAGPGTGKSTLMRRVGGHFLKKGYDIDYIYCSSDPQSLDGLLIPKLRVAIVDGTHPHVIEPTAPGALEQYVNLGTAWNLDLLSSHREKILNLRNTSTQAYKKLYSHYANALNIHDDWEKVYIDAIDREKADAFKKDVCKNLLNFPKINRKALEKHRFFGASTPTGTVDFVENLIDPIATRYFIKGRPGTGKSTLLRSIVKHMTSLGYDTDIYHCSFDPKSLDMVVINELGICFFDATAPHEYEPSREGDHILDTYKIFVQENTDENNQEEIKGFEEEYKKEMALGRLALAEARAAHDELEEIYKKATNFEILDGFYEQIKDRIEELEK